MHRLREEEATGVIEEREEGVGGWVVLETAKIPKFDWQDVAKRHRKHRREGGKEEVRRGESRQ